MADAQTLEPERVVEIAGEAESVPVQQTPAWEECANHLPVPHRKECEIQEPNGPKQRGLEMPLVHRSVRLVFLLVAWVEAVR
jgi:hypothetical protein